MKLCEPINENQQQQKMEPGLKVGKPAPIINHSEMQIKENLENNSELSPDVAEFIRLEDLFADMKRNYQKIKKNLPDVVKFQELQKIYEIEDQMISLAAKNDVFVAKSKERIEGSELPVWIKYEEPPKKIEWSGA